ncbi:MAG: nascent polypeptide-associated complex protein [Candidatus Pacearchaeota archaeon]
MFPGLGGLDPKKMQAVMKQMGIGQEEIPTEKVTIEKQDGSKIIIQPASVTKITMQGQESFQISGDVSEESEEKFSNDDIQTVIEKTGCSKKDAKQALENSDGDLAEAILELGE